MKYLGLDLGSRTLGIAISDALGMIARAYDTLRFKDDDYDYAAAQTIEICKKEGVEGIVLGYPKHMNGDVGIRAQISVDFKEKLLALNPKLKIILIDERLTTVVVDRVMLSGNLRREKRKEKKDEMAAVVILQDYLNTL